IYDFKHASPNFIRQKYNDPRFEKFSLPFCSRCTEVIVRAVNNILAKAAAVGKLINRINKEFVFYSSDKEIDNNRFPKIIHAICSVQRKNANYIARFIELEIKKFSIEDI